MNPDYSRVYRLLHWTMAVLLLLLLFTIFLRLTWMNKNHMADIIGRNLADDGIELSRERLVAIAKQVRAPMWDWHIYIGYALTGVFLVRFLLPLAGEMRFRSPLSPGLGAVEKFKRWTYLVFYGCIVVSLVTGVLIRWGPKSMKAALESVHVLSIYYLVPFIFIHWIGVFIAERTNRRGIVSEMVGGTKRRRA